MATRIGIGLIILWSAGGLCAGHPSGSLPAPIPLEIIEGRPVVDGVMIDGAGPFRFLLDTGAQTNQIGAPLAAALGLSPAYRVELATVAGTALVPGRRVGSISLGTAAAAGQEILFTPLDAVAALSPGIQGVLGQEFLSRFDYLFDFSGRSLTFHPAAPPPGIRLDFEFRHGRPAIRTARGTLVLDSGSAHAVFFCKAPPPSGFALSTAAGKAAASAPHPVRLRIAGADYRVMAVAIAAPDRDESGLLPAAAFDRVFVSNSGRFLILSPPAAER